MKIFEDSSRKFKDRAIDLISHMTLREKTRQMVGKAPGIRRLNVKPYNWWNECLHGVGRAGIATVFPQAIGLAATFDPEMVFEIASIISDEARAKHHEAQRKKDYSIYKGLTYWTPNINIFRDPRWGRGQETYGEDPYLTAQLGINFVKGLQGEDPKYLKLVATPKHFAVHSGPEADRHRFDAITNTKDLYETYLFAFKECIEKANAYSIMGAYNRTNGEPCCASKTLLQDILREQFKFQGFVVSDCGAIWDIHAHHKITSGPSESAALAVKNGCDLNCGITYRFLKRAVRKKLITEAEIDTAVTRLMLARMKLGMFDVPENVPYAQIPITVVDSPKHRTMALKAAEKSIVMLKNQNQFLPLLTTGQKIAVIGPNADHEEVLWGNYNGIASKTVTPFEGIKTIISPDNVVFAQGTKINKGNPKLLAQAISTAQDADLIILCLGLSQKIEGEEGEFKNVGDRGNLGLPVNQMELFSKISALNKPIILILINGSPILLDWAHNNVNVKTILEAWYPGEEGGTALANIIFGKVSPSGRLPLTYPMKMDDLPPIKDYSMLGRTYRYTETEPLYPFGYGLSYAQFRYQNLQLPNFEMDISSELSFIISVDITNTSQIAADEIVQLYIKDLDASVIIPHYSLQGVKRVHFNSQETEKVSFAIGARQLALINDEGKAILEPGQFTLFIGGQQPDKRSNILTSNEVKSVNLTLLGSPLEIPY